MKIISKTVEKAFEIWKPDPQVRCFHFCAAFDGNKMIMSAQNNPVRMCHKIHRMGKQYNIPTYVQYSYPHAETSLVSKLLNRFDYIDPSWKIVVMRINRRGLILNSKPCVNCQKILDAVGLCRVYYSLDNGSFTGVNYELA